MRILLIMFLLSGCSVFSYDPCAEKYPHNKLDQEVCKERRQRDMDRAARGLDRFDTVRGITF